MSEEEFRALPRHLKMAGLQGASCMCMAERCCCPRVVCSGSWRPDSCLPAAAVVLVAGVLSWGLDSQAQRVQSDNTGLLWRPASPPLLHYTDLP